MFNLAGALCYGKDNILDNDKKKTGILLLALLIPFFKFSLLAHNLSSYNADYTLYVVDYCPDNHTATWGINYTKILVCLWAFLLFFIIMRTRLANRTYRPLIALLCLASLCCNLLLLTLDEYNYTIWYISRGIEVSSKLFVVSFLIYNIFRSLATLQQTGGFHDVLTNIYNRRYFFNSVESLLSRPVVKDFCVMLVDIISSNASMPNRDIVWVIKCWFQLSILSSKASADDIFSATGG